MTPARTFASSLAGEFTKKDDDKKSLLKELEDGRTGPKIRWSKEDILCLVQAIEEKGWRGRRLSRDDYEVLSRITGYSPTSVRYKLNALRKDDYSQYKRIHAKLAARNAIPLSTQILSPKTKKRTRGYTVWDPADILFLIEETRLGIAEVAPRERISLPKYVKERLYTKYTPQQVRGKISNIRQSATSPRKMAEKLREILAEKSSPGQHEQAKLEMQTLQTLQEQHLRSLCIPIELKCKDITTALKTTATNVSEPQKLQFTIEIEISLKQQP